MTTANDEAHVLHSTVEGQGETGQLEQKDTAGVGGVLPGFPQSHLFSAAFD